MEGMLGVWELRGSETHFSEGDLLVGRLVVSCVPVCYTARPESTGRLWLSKERALFP